MTQINALLFTNTVYKLASVIFSVLGLLCIFTPTFISYLTLKPNTYQLVKDGPIHLFIQFLGITLFILASAICTAGSNPQCSKSIGSGMLVSALFMIWLGRSGNIVGIVSNYCIMILTCSLAVIGLVGLMIPSNAKKTPTTSRSSSRTASRNTSRDNSPARSEKRVNKTKSTISSFSFQIPNQTSRKDD